MRAAWLVVLIAGLLAGCGPDAESSVVPGQVSDEVEGRSVAIRLPVGELTVTIGSPRDEPIDARDAADAEEHEPPSGGAFIPVQWDFDTFADIPGSAVINRDPLEAQASLRLGDEVVELPTPYVVQGIGIASPPVQVFYVPSEDADPDLSLEVTYDGLTQVADVSTGEVAESAATSLYGDPVTAPRVPCGPLAFTRYPGLRAAATCRASVERVPYLPGEGWAEEGTSYPVVGYRLRLTDARVAGRSWESSAADAMVTVDFAESVASVESLAGTVPDSLEEVGDIEVFAPRAPGGKALVTATFTVDPQDPDDGASEPDEIVVQATIPLP